MVKCSCGFSMEQGLFLSIVYDAVTAYKGYAVDYMMKKKW